VGVSAPPIGAGVGAEATDTVPGIAGGAARSAGARVPRIEDARLLTGRGRYVDDIALPGMLHVAFVRSPGMWNSLMETHAQIYYTAQDLGVFEKIHSVAFNEIHQKGNYLQTQDDIRKMFVAQGVDPAAFDKSWSSFGVTSAVKKAGTRMREYKVDGVPNLIVNGKYRVSSGDGMTQADMLKVAEFLIEQERKKG
jgi:predicted DsbA family dithiol-disulfide isomerase